MTYQHGDQSPSSPLTPPSASMTPSTTGDTYSLAWFAVSLAFLTPDCSCSFALSRFTAALLRSSPSAMLTTLGGGKMLDGLTSDSPLSYRS